MEAVAAGDDVADQRLVLAVMLETDRGLVAGEVIEARSLGVKQQRPTGGEPRGDQVLHHLLLAVDVHQLAAG